MQFNLLLMLEECNSGFLAEVLSFFLDIAQGILSQFAVILYVFSF
jgi:hypothetical protein